MAEKTAEEKAQAQREREAAKAERERQAAAEAAAADEGKEEAEPETFPAERLIAEAPQFFGHEPHVVAGALEHLGGNKKNFTVAEVKEAIDAFNDHEVVSESGEEL